jgi:hypothetical protein
MIWGLSFALLTIVWLGFKNRQRARLQEVRDLVPNCLLTTYPLVFVPGHRSLFYFLAYWNQIPHWLASHGYEVFHLQLPWNNKKKRQQSLKKFLQEKSAQPEKFHLFIDESSYAEFEEVVEENRYECLASVTLIGHRPNTRTSLSPRLQIPIEDLVLPEVPIKTPMDWRLHQFWTRHNTSFQQLGWQLNPQQGLILLERARFLAERDLIQAPRSPSL